MTSSPKPTKAKPTHKKQARILNINFQGLRKKRKLLETIIESTDPDIIIGTETWLDPTFRSSEIFPDYYLYDIERRVHSKDPHGGVLIAAVLIAAKKTTSTRKHHKKQRHRTDNEKC